MVTTPLVSLEQARDRLRIDGVTDQADLTRMLSEGTRIVLGYLKPQPIGSPLDRGWTIETVPEHIQTAILLVIRAIYDGEPDPLSQAVIDILHRDRDPALA
jgi:hypothetical protein